MKILAIETSCDETGIAIVEVQNDTVRILSNQLSSQASIHAQFGGVFPTVAKREHVRALVPLLRNALQESTIRISDPERPSKEIIESIKSLLSHEQELFVHLSLFTLECGVPDIDAIAVTYGPGLEPALWVGVNFAKALSQLWNKPIVAVNHMEGHICAALTAQTSQTTRTAIQIVEPKYPLLSLLVSGGHTELVLSEEKLQYKIIGQTRDDAAGECFDKTARMLGLPYPGGPEISRLAAEARMQNLLKPFILPRPMITAANTDFSFSGLKTAVLKIIKELGTITDIQKMQLAREIEDSIVETLIHKLARAIESTGAQSVVVSGGVSANAFLCSELTTKLKEKYPYVHLFISPRPLSTDNALMIALASIPYVEQHKWTDIQTLAAQGNLRLGS